MNPYSAEPRQPGAGRIVQSAAVCLAASAIAAWLYAPYGYNGLDDGFIQGLAWRVANGQLPYLDFIYVRPPGSILLHTVPLLVLPDALQAIFERWFFFFSMAASSFVAATILTRVVDVRAWNLPRYALALLFFVVSVQDFPPMPWHTVDGLALAVVAVFCLCCTRSSLGLVLGALFAVLSASCKQPFAAVPVAALLYVAYVRGRRDAAIVGAAVVAFSAAVGGAMLALGMLGEALAQCTSQTTLGSLFHAGFMSYARALPYFLVPVGAWLAWSMVSRRFAKTPLPAAGMAYAVMLWVFGTDIALTLIQGRFQTPAFNYPGALFVLVVLAILFPRKGSSLGRTLGTWFPFCHRLLSVLPRLDPFGDDRARATLALLLLVSWCGSISWGYPSPVLLSAPWVFGALAAAAHYVGAAPRRVVLLALPLALAAQFVGYRYPYRESPRATLIAPLGETFERLNRVYTSADNRDRFDELRRLAQRHPRFTVLPGLPAAHYLTGAIPPVSVDWARNSEAAGRTPELVRELEQSDARVFLERAAEPLCDRGPQCSELANHVARDWTVVEEARYFRVYRKADPARAP